MNNTIDEEVRRLHRVISVNGIAFTNRMITDQAQFFDRRAEKDPNGRTSYSNWVETNPNIRNGFKQVNDFYHATLKAYISGREISYLDIGCGDGERTRKFMLEMSAYAYVQKFLGLDISSDMVAHAKTILGPENVVQGDITDLSFEGDFDVISCMYAVLGLIWEENIPRALSNVKRTLKKEGLLCIDEIEFEYEKFRSWGYDKITGNSGKYMAYYVRLNENPIIDTNGQPFIGTVRTFTPQEIIQFVRPLGFTVMDHKRIKSLHENETDFGTEHAFVLKKHRI